MRSAVAIIVAISSGLYVCPLALAAGIEDISVVVQWEGNLWKSADHSGSLRVVSNPDGTYSVKFYGYVPGQWSALWNLTIDPDPFVQGLFVFTNQSQSFGSFVITADCPGVSLPGPTDMSGSIAGTLLDRDGDGATVSAPAEGALYTALIDGDPARTLLDDPFTVSAGQYEANAFGPASFSHEVGPAVTQALYLRHAFLLTGNDSISVSSSFVVTPEPTGLCLIGMILVPFLLRGRLRSSTPTAP